MKGFRCLLVRDAVDETDEALFPEPSAALRARLRRRALRRPLDEADPGRGGLAALAKLGVLPGLLLRMGLPSRAKHGKPENKKSGTRTE